MSTILKTSVLSLAALVTIGAATAGDRGDRRQERQAERVYAGANDGSLTARETQRLGNQQLRIESFEDRLTSDGDYSKKDKVKFEVVQDAASTSIYRLRHNDRVRN